MIYQYTTSRTRAQRQRKAKPDRGNIKKTTAHCVAACTLQIPTGIKRLRWDLHIGSLEVPKLTKPKLSLKQS